MESVSKELLTPALVSVASPEYEINKFCNNPFSLHPAHVADAMARSLEMSAGLLPQEDPRDGAAVSAGQHGAEGREEEGLFQGHPPLSVQAWG